MPYMVVTLEVSKLSGWSNADAYCRESKGGKVRAGRRWATAGHAACRRGIECTFGAGHGEERT